jgi:hypothetical protein
MHSMRRIVIGGCLACLIGAIGVHLLRDEEATPPSSGGQGEARRDDSAIQPPHTELQLKDAPDSGGGLARTRAEGESASEWRMSPDEIAAATQFMRENPASDVTKVTLVESRAGGSYMGVRLAQSSTVLGCSAGEIMWIWDSREELRARFPTLASRLAQKFAVGQTRYALVTRVFWRRHLIMIGDEIAK